MSSELCTTYMNHLKCDLSHCAKNQCFLQNLRAKACVLERLTALVKWHGLQKVAISISMHWFNPDISTLIINTSTYSSSEPFLWKSTCFCWTLTEFTNLDKCPLGSGALNSFKFGFVACNSWVLRFEFPFFCVHEIPYLNLKLFCPSGVHWQHLRLGLYSPSGFILLLNTHHPLHSIKRVPSSRF